MMLNKHEYVCVVIDVLTDVWVEEVIKMLVEVFVTNVWADDMVTETSSEV